MHLGIDLDNTLVDTLDICLRLFNPQESVQLTRDSCTTYAFFEAYGWDEPRYLEMYARYGEEIHRDAAPIPHAIEALRALAAAGHRLTIMTARPLPYVGISIDWLNAYEVPYDAVSFNHDKLAACRLMGVDLLVDDTPEHAHAFSSADTPMILIDHPYNRAIHHPHVHRCTTWAEIQARVTALARQGFPADR